MISKKNISTVYQFVIILFLIVFFLTSVSQEARSYTGDIHSLYGTVTIDNLPPGTDGSITVGAGDISGENPDVATEIRIGEHYSLPVFEGTYNVSCSFSFEGNNYGYGLESTLIITGDTELNIVVPTIILSGTVVDSNGVPIPGTRVELPGPVGFRIVTDENGYYEVLFMPYRDVYILEITPPSESGIPGAFKTIDITVSTVENIILDGIMVSDIDNDGYTEGQGDCDDNDASIYPGAEEICGDDIDQDCDGEDLECEITSGDLDDDGVINESDYNLFRSTLGKCTGDTAFIAEVDYDDDGCITYADYSVWYGYYRNQSDSIPPSKITHTSPSGTAQEPTPTFTWSEDPASTWYKFWVGDPNGDKVFAQWYEATEICSGGSCSVTLDTELAEGSYEWYIKSWNDYGKVWSDGMSFSLF